MTLLLMLGVASSLDYAMYRGARKWGAAFFLFLAAAVGFMGASGVVAERLWGPEWSWNFAHHGPGYALAALIQGIWALFTGLYFKAARGRTAS